MDGGNWRQDQDEIELLRGELRLAMAMDERSRWQRDQAEQRVAQLEKALAKYGWHAWPCEAYHLNPGRRGPCSCGYAALTPPQPAVPQSDGGG